MDILHQAYVIIKKNLMCTLRNKGEVIRELLIPLIAGLVIYSTSIETSYIINNVKTTLASNDFFFILMVPIYLPTAIMGFTRKLIINFFNEKKEKYKEYQKVKYFIYSF